MRYSHPSIQSRSVNEANSAEERGKIDVLFALGHNPQESIVRRPGMQEGGSVRRMSTTRQTLHRQSKHVENTKWPRT